MIVLHRVRYFARGLWVDKHFAQWVTTIVIAVNVGLGSVILAGGVARFAPPSYNPLVDLVNGHTWIWGVWIVFAGMLTTVPFRWPNIIGLWLSLFWHAIWMSCFVVAVTNFNVAVSTPIPMYGGMAMISAALLTARVIEGQDQ